jgi:hypothetical protein
MMYFLWLFHSYASIQVFVKAVITADQISEDYWNLKLILSTKESSPNKQLGITIDESISYIIYGESESYKEDRDWGWWFIYIMGNFMKANSDI